MYSYELIELEKLPVYKELIFEDVYDDLWFYYDLSECAILGVGAYDENGVVGAMILDLGIEDRITLLSIMVKPECRRKGIAKEMFHRAMMALAYDESLHEEKRDEFVTFEAPYALEGDALIAFEGFLESIGIEEEILLPQLFTYQIEEMKELDAFRWVFNGEERSPVPTVNINECIAEVGIGIRAMYNEDLDADHTFCAFGRNEETCWTISENVGNSEYTVLISPTIGDEAVLASALGRTARSIYNLDKDGRMIISIDTSELSDTLTDFGMKPIHKYSPKKAMMEILFNQK